MATDGNGSTVAVSPSAPLNSQNRFAPERLRPALATRISFSEATDIIGKMLRGYPNGDNVPNAYIMTLAEALARYPKIIAERAADVTHGVPRQTRFLPTPADIAEWGDRNLLGLRAIVQRDDAEKAVIAQMREREREAKRLEEARAKRESYDELVARHGQNWGISDAAELDERARRSAFAAMGDANARLVSRSGAVVGSASSGLLVSGTLVALMREKALAPAIWPRGT